MENGEGERQIYCTWEIISHLGKGERGMDTVTESYHSPVKISAWFRASSRRCSSNTDDLVKPRSVFEHGLCCHGATSLGCEDGSENEREVRRGKFLGKFFRTNAE